MPRYERIMQKLFSRFTTTFFRFQPEVSEERRKFLRLMLMGGGFFLAGKVFGDFFNFFTAEAGKTVFFENFRITETRKTLGVYDRDGSEILLIDKDL